MTDGFTPLGRPWILQLGPFVMPCEAREELCTIAHGLTREEFADKVWAMRDEAFGPVRKSRRKKWPINAVAEKPVTQLRAIPKRASA